MTALFLILTTLPSFARAPSQSPADFKAFVDSLSSVAERTYFQKRSKEIDGFAQSIVVASRAENPLSFYNDSSYSRVDVEGPANEINSRNTLEYKLDSGFTADLDYRHFNSSDYAASDRNTTSSVGLRLRQELIKSGSASLKVQERKFEYLDALGKLVSGEVTRWGERVKLQKSLAMVFQSYCEKEDLSSIVEKVKGTIKIAEAQHGAKVVGTRELLRFKSLELILLRRQLETGQRLGGLEQSISQYGPDFSRALKKAIAQGFECETQRTGLANVELPPKGSLTEDFAKNPVVQGFDIESQQADAQLERVSILKLPSLELYSGASLNQRYRESAYNDFQVGLTFTYVLSSDGFTQDKKRFFKQKSLNELRKKEYQYEFESAVDTLYYNIEVAPERYRLVQSQVSHTEKLLKLIETQQELGMIDATSATTTFLDYMDTLTLLRDVWLGHSLSALQIGLIQKQTKLNIKLR